MLVVAEGLRKRYECESFPRTPFSVEPTMSKNGSSSHVKGAKDAEKGVDTLVGQMQIKEGKEDDPIEIDSTELVALPTKNDAPKYSPPHSPLDESSVCQHIRI